MYGPWLNGVCISIISLRTSLNSSQSSIGPKEPLNPNHKYVKGIVQVSMDNFENSLFMANHPKDISRRRRHACQDKGKELAKDL
jgi:hypothetical protein